MQLPFWGDVSPPTRCRKQRISRRSKAAPGETARWRFKKRLGPSRRCAALDVPIQELLLIDTPPEIVQQPKPSRKVLERLEKIQSLPRRKQDAILTTIDHFLNSAAAS